jgi:hypothetical protein
MSARTFVGLLVLSAIAAAGCNAQAKPLPVAVVSAEALAQEWKANQKATLVKYTGKRLEVSGVVYRAGSDNAANQPVIYLNEKDADKLTWAPVKCLLPEQGTRQAAQLCPGQTVKLRGSLVDLTPDAPVLDDCEFLATGSSPAVTVSPEELAREYKADKEKAEKKYRGKWAVVAGTVTGIEHPKKKWRPVNGDGKVIEKTEERCYRFFLANDADKPTPVCAECCAYKSEALRKKLAAFRKGQKIKVRGRCDTEAWKAARTLVLEEGVLLD